MNAPVCPGSGQRRRPPAYQEYGSDLLALEDVRLMSLAERGLLATLRWHLWVNDTAPSDPRQLARVLGVEERGLVEALTPRVLKFFAPCGDRSERLHSPELRAYMEKVLKRRADLAEYGSI